MVCGERLPTATLDGLKRCGWNSRHIKVINRSASGAKLINYYDQNTAFKKIKNEKMLASGDTFLFHYK